MNGCRNVWKARLARLLSYDYVQYISRKKKYRTLFIWYKVDKREGWSEETCSLKVKFESRMTPWSLADYTGVSSWPREGTDASPVFLIYIFNLFSFISHLLYHICSLFWSLLARRCPLYIEQRVWDTAPAVHPHLLPAEQGPSENVQFKSISYHLKI